MRASNFTALTGLFLLLAAACQEEPVQTPEPGDEIIFSAEANGSEMTRTSYSGTKYSTKYERIDWENGDVIRIYCPQCTDPSSHYADYQVKSGTVTTVAGGQSSASFEKMTNALVWVSSTADHSFYAVYPRPSADSITTALSGAAVTANLAAEQNTLAGAMSGSTGTDFVLQPDLRWQLMTAVAGPYKPSTFSGSTVFLNFTPLTTAVEFQLSNGAEADLVLKKVNVISEGTQIAGRFTISDISTNAADGYPAVTPNTSDAAMKTVSLSLADNITIKKGKTFKFTFFFLPGQDLNDLKFQIVKSDNSTFTTRLGYTDGTGVKIPRCKKSFITGIVVPAGIQWTIDFNPTLSPWVADDTQSINVK